MARALSDEEQACFFKTFCSDGYGKIIKSKGINAVSSASLLHADGLVNCLQNEETAMCLKTKFFAMYRQPI